MKNDLRYYLNLKYEIVIVPVPSALGGGFEARIPQLGGDAFCGYGDTERDALDTLNLVKKDLFSNYLEKGEQIPEPIILCDTTKPTPNYLMKEDSSFIMQAGSYTYALAS